MRAMEYLPAAKKLCAVEITFMIVFITAAFNIFNSVLKPEYNHVSSVISYKLNVTMKSYGQKLLFLEIIIKVIRKQHILLIGTSVSIYIVCYNANKK